jgi:hypothetical protein
MAGSMMATRPLKLFCMSTVSLQLQRNTQADPALKRLGYCRSSLRDYWGVCCGLSRRWARAAQARCLALAITTLPLVLGFD